MKISIALLFVAANAAAQTSYLVTSTADSGPGTLREGIAWANANCAGTPCAIRFAEPLDPIELASPLPELAACGTVSINPGAEMAPAPPVVEVRGEHVPSGNAFTLRATCAATTISVARMNVHGFPETAIAVAPGAAAEHHVTVDACILRGNGRGIVADSARLVLEVTNSTIAGNAHSAIFVWSSQSVSIRTNALNGNGASGIFVCRGRATITENTISFNRDFGVAVSRLAGAVSVTQNSIFENGWQGIDWELNGRVDADIPDDAPMPRAPVLTEARFDPVKKETVIRGIAHLGSSPDMLYPRLILYATPLSRTHAEGETPLLAIYLQPGTQHGPVDVPFEFHVPVSFFEVHDAFLTAQTTFTTNEAFIDTNTSEFSNGVPVN